MHSSRKPSLRTCLLFATAAQAQTDAHNSVSYEASSSSVADVLLRSPEQKLQLELKHRAQVQKRLGQLLRRGYTPHDVNMGWDRVQCGPSLVVQCSEWLTCPPKQFVPTRMTTKRAGCVCMPPCTRCHRQQPVQLIARPLQQLERHVGPNIHMPRAGACWGGG